MKKVMIPLLILILAVFLLVGCKESGYSFDGEYYVNPDGVIMEDEEVTLDIIALCNHGKNFDALSAKDRQKVICDYLTYHLPDDMAAEKQNKEALIALLADVNMKGVNLPTDFEGDLEKTSGFLSQATAVLSLADFHAESMMDDAFGDFIDNMSKACDVADVAITLSKSCLIIADLSNNDLSNKEEYAVDLVKTLGFITSNLPVLGDYFEEGLSIVEKGVKIVIKNDSINRDRLEVYEREIDGKTFFSITTATANFEFILDPQKWDDSAAPTISAVFAHSDQFADMTATDLEWIRKYLLFRIGYEMEYTDCEVTTPPTEPAQPACAHVLQEKSRQEATCEEDGFITYTCAKKCGKSETEIIPATGHDYEETVVAPTYEAQGYTKHTCKNCGDSYEDSFVEPLGFLPPDVSQSQNWYGQGTINFSKEREFAMQIYSASEDHITGYLEVYHISSGEIIYKHRTKFEGTGKKTENGYEYLLVFENSVTFGVLPTYTYSEMTIYYNSKKDTFSFDYMYHVTMDHILEE
jgi:hypothetical protein